MNDDDYELLPHKQIADLKKTVEELKGGPSAEKLKDSMDNLSESIGNLMSLFSAATKEMQNTDKDKDLSKKVDKLLKQNKIIAESIIAIADMIRDMSRKGKIDAAASIAHEKPRLNHERPKPYPIQQPEQTHSFQAPPIQPKPMPSQSQQPRFEMPAFNMPPPSGSPMSPPPMMGAPPPAPPPLQQQDFSDIAPPASPDDVKKKRKGLLSAFKKKE